MRLMQTSESLLARGSSIILLWDCHVSWLTTCPFVRDMMAVQSRKLENLQGEEEETVHYSLGDITHNIRTYCTVYTSTFFPFLPTTRSHVLKTQVQIQQNNPPPDPDPHLHKTEDGPAAKLWASFQALTTVLRLESCVPASMTHTFKNFDSKKCFFVNSTAVVLWNIAVQSPANQIPLRQRTADKTWYCRWQRSHRGSIEAIPGCGATLQPRHLVSPVKL